MLLNLESNDLYGNIPNGIVKCKSMVQLRLNGNKITGNFPSSLCRLVNLSAIELGGTGLVARFHPRSGTVRSYNDLISPETTSRPNYLTRSRDSHIW
ncbi:putative non-specific serine/threonine protein kinase [Helianthus annuus]|nr:putative non-specific serine/threonine protein kinase [Helianthus annuus]